MKQLAQHLGITQAEAKKLWDSVGLDGDEQASLKEVFGLAVKAPPDGRVSTGKVESGLAKFKPPPKPKSKRKKAAK